MTTKTKVKRKLSDISFESEGAHVALVSKTQGGPANNHNYALVLKSCNFSQEYIEKMQQVRVTMELPDFLRKFFSVYYEDAEVLARMMGYVPPETEDSEPYSYEDYITSKLESFEVLKSINDAQSIPDVLSTLDETQYLSMLNDQFTIEKALNKIDKQAEQKTAVKESDPVVKATESDTSKIMHEVGESEVSVSKVTKQKETNMTKPVTTDVTQVTKTVAVEMVEKSALETLQKSLEDQKVELQKALDVIAVFEAEKKAQIVKSKTAQFEQVIKDEKILAPILKAALTLEQDEDFNALLASVTSLVKESETQKEKLEKSALFTEQGATTSQEEKPQESAVARILKSKQVK